MKFGLVFLLFASTPLLASAEPTMVIRCQSDDSSMTALLQSDSEGINSELSEIVQTGTPIPVSSITYTLRAKISGLPTESCGELSATRATVEYTSPGYGVTHVELSCLEESLSEGCK